MTKFTDSRKKDIMRRAQMYAEGELSLEDFMLLEQVDTEFMEDEEEPEQEPNYREEADKLKAMHQQELEQKEQAKRPPIEKIVKGEEHTLTYEEWSKLGIAEQTALYNEHPTEIGKLIRGTASSISYSDVDIVVPRYTVEQFRAMSLQEMQELYNYDEEQYMELSAAAAEARI